MREVEDKLGSFGSGTALTLYTVLSLELNQNSLNHLMQLQN